MANLRKRLRIRFKIRTLLIITALLSLPAWYYGMTLQEYRAEQRAITKLEKAGWRIDSIHKEGRASPETLSEKTIALLNMPFDWLIGSEFNERCTILELTPIGEAKSVTAIKDLPYLKHFNLYETCDCDSHVDTLLKLPRLESVSYFIDNINVDSYYRLTSKGIDVSHYGLKDRTFERNYLRYGSRFFPVDLHKSHLGIRLVEGESGLRFSLNINTYEPHPRFQSPAPSMYTVDLKAEQTITELIRENKVLEAKAEFDDGSNFYDGIHQSLASNSLQLISKTENQLRLKWGFKTDLDEQGGEIEVQLPIDVVSVHFETSIAEKEACLRAKKMFGRHFDAGDFNEPVVDEKGNRFIFKAK